MGKKELREMRTYARMNVKCDVGVMMCLLRHHGLHDELTRSCGVSREEEGSGQDDMSCDERLRITLSFCRHECDACETSWGRVGW